MDLLNPYPDENRIQDALLTLSTESQELYLNNDVTVLEEIPSPLKLHRDYIAPNMPVIFRGAVKHWPAITNWTTKYLRNKIGDKVVTVTVTPNGYADAPNNGFFVMPEERSMKFGDFLDIMDNPEKHFGVYYVQKQNSNFTDEFSDILDDAEHEVPWFSEALGKKPDAVNFWMGDQRAITSMHKDHYENIYCVVSGYKDFILIPPSDLPWVPYAKFPVAKYKETSPGQFEILEDKESGIVPWICIDPVSPDLISYPQYKHSHPVRCRVHAGDALYLPSLWFHHVSQSHSCIAVNFWYDMEYDIKYNYYKLLQNLTWKEDPDCS